MKILKTVIAIALFSTMVFFGSAAVSFAEEHGQGEIQALKDAATALQSVNPDLSNQLSKYADKETNEREEAEEKEGTKENEAAHIKLLQDSAAALKQSNPQLADALTKYADKEANEEREEKK